MNHPFPDFQTPNSADPRSADDAAQKDDWRNFWRNMWEKRCSDGAVFFSIGDSCYIKLYPFLFLNGDVFPLLLALFGKWAGFTIRDGDQSDFADLDHRDLIYF